MSSYSEGQVHQLANALEAVGFTRQDLTMLGQHPQLADLRGFARGTHILVPAPSLRNRRDRLIEECRLEVSYFCNHRIFLPAFASPLPAALVGEPFPVPKNGMMGAEIRRNLGTDHLFRAEEFVPVILEGIEGGTLPKTASLYYVEGVDENGERGTFTVLIKCVVGKNQYVVDVAKQDDITLYDCGWFAYPRGESQS